MSSNSTKNLSISESSGRPTSRSISEKRRMEDVEKIREAMEKEFSGWLVPQEKSATEASLPPSKTPSAMADSDQNFFQDDKNVSSSNKSSTYHETRKRFVDFVSAANRAHRENSIFERRHHDFYVRRSLDDERWYRDRDEIIPLEKVSQGDEMPELPPTLHELVKGMAHATGLQYLGVALATLGATLIAVRGRVWVRINRNWREFAVSMHLQSAPSGFRKTQFVEMLQRPFKTYMEQKNLAYSASRKTDEEKNSITTQVATALCKGRIKAVVSKNLEGSLPDLSEIDAIINNCVEEKAHIMSLKRYVPYACCLFVNKCSTPKALELLIENGGCLGCITDEADMLTSTLLNPQHGIPSLVLHGHTGQYFSEQNCRKAMTFQQIALPMVHIVQPHEMALLYSNGRKIEQGLVARFVPFFYDTSEDPVEIGEGAFDDYFSVISGLLEKFYSQDCQVEPLEIGLSEKGENVIYEFGEIVKRDIRPKMPVSGHPYCDKSCGLAARLAFAIHAWNNVDPLDGNITAEEVKQACNIVYETFHHALHAYSPTGLRAYPGAVRIINTLLNINYEERNHIISHGLDSRRIEQRIKLSREGINDSLRFLEFHNALSIYDDSSPNLKLHVHRDFFRFFSQKRYK